MGLATATIEMQAPEEHRERLHDLVKAARTVLVLSSGRAGERAVEQPMALLRTGDDTTMYVATSLDPRQLAALARDPRVTVALQGTGCAVFDAEIAIVHDRGLVQGLLDGLGREWRRLSTAILVLTPIEGAYWSGARRYAYQYRLVPPPPPERDAGASASTAG